MITIVAHDYSRPTGLLMRQPPDLGSIHSVFSRAINLQHADGIMAILRLDLPRMPNGLRLSYDAFAQLAERLHPGTPVQLGGGVLVIPQADINLCLPSLPGWEPRPPVESLAWNRAAVRAHLHALATALLRDSSREGLAPLAAPLLLSGSAPDTPLARIALPPLVSLAQSGWYAEPRCATEAARSLAGLGPGLTPAGDDALGGYLATLSLLGPLLGSADFPYQHLAETMVEAAIPRTTMLSATLLRHAARGEVAEPLGILIRDLSAPADNPEEVRRAGEAVMRTGATSGGDTLLGMLVGLLALEGSD